MIFDPFGDYEEAGYLRNRYRLKDMDKLQELEFIAVNDSLEEAFEYLKSLDSLEYDNVLDVHRILFETIYPWAGQDREETAPNKAISKADVQFADPAEVKRAIAYALSLGKNLELLKKKPGMILGLFAFGHPFLDGNGRVIMLVFTELLFRTGISVDWSRSHKSDYLAALTREIEDPDKGHLDRYLAPLISRAPSREKMLKELIEVKGLFSPLAQQY